MNALAINTTETLSSIKSLLIFTAVASLLLGCQQQSTNELPPHITLSPKQPAPALVATRTQRSQSSEATIALSKSTSEAKVGAINEPPPSITHTYTKLPIPCRKSLSPPIDDSAKLEDMLIKSGKITHEMTPEQRAEQVNHHIHTKTHAYDLCQRSKEQK